MTKRKTIKIKVKIRPYEKKAVMSYGKCSESSNGCGGSGHSGGQLRS
jgi:hypothetical protein